MDAVPNGWAFVRVQLRPYRRVDAVGTEALSHRMQQHHLQLTAMDRVLRPAVAGGKASKLNADSAAEAVMIDQLAGRDAGGRQLVGQPQLNQIAGGVREDVDADTKRRELPGRVDDSHVNTRRMQAQRRGQPAKACAADQDFHAEAPLSGVHPRVCIRWVVELVGCEVAYSEKAHPARVMEGFHDVPGFGVGRG